MTGLVPVSGGGGQSSRGGVQVGMGSAKGLGEQRKTKNRMWSPGVRCRPQTGHKTPLHDASMHDLYVIYRAEPASLTARDC